MWRRDIEYMNDTSINRITYRKYEIYSLLTFVQEIECYVHNVFSKLNWLAYPAHTCTLAPNIYMLTDIFLMLAYELSVSISGTQLCLLTSNK